MEDCRGREWTAVENPTDNLSKMGQEVDSMSRDIVGHIHKLWATVTIKETYVWIKWAKRLKKMITLFI